MKRRDAETIREGEKGKWRKGEEMIAGGSSSTLTLFPFYPFLLSLHLCG
jgi:hypothetical protein